MGSSAPNGDTDPGRGLTRRQFSRRAVGATAGLLAGSAASAAPPEKPDEKAPPADDPRLPALEKERGLPYTDPQRQNLPPQLKDMDSARTALHKFPLSDGGSEPGTVFFPVLPGRAGAKPGEKAHG